MAGERMTKVLVLDIDYTISPSTVDGPRTHFSCMYQGAHAIPDRILSWFERYETVWCTGWMYEAEDIVDAPVLDTPNMEGWWKGHAVNDLLTRRPDITHLVWADDEHDEHPDWAPVRDGVKVLRICPHRGLTNDQADLIERAMA